MAPCRKGSSHLNPQDFLSLLAQLYPHGQFLQDVGDRDWDGKVFLKDFRESAQELFFDALEGHRGSEHQSLVLCQTLIATDKICWHWTNDEELKEDTQYVRMSPPGDMWHIQLMCVCFEQQLVVPGSHRPSHMAADLQFFLLTAPIATLGHSDRKGLPSIGSVSIFFLISLFLQNSVNCWGLCQDSSNVFCTHRGWSHN